MIVDRNSRGYVIGKLLARATLVIIGFFVGKKFTQKPIDKGYPKTPKK